MKTKLGVLIFLLAATFLRAQTNNLTTLLQQGLFEEQANRNLEAAIADYQSLARQFDKDRQLAATAVFRLGECYRMQGKTNEAALEYKRIVNEFSDQTPLVTLSRQDLTGMGMAQPDNGKPIEHSGEVPAEASSLAAQISGIENMKTDLEEQARAVQAIFPDEELKNMLLQLPKLQKQEADFKANPKLIDTYFKNGFDTFSAIGSKVIHYGDATNLLAEFQRQTLDQSAQIQQRVNFILGIQKARLKVLQSAEGFVAAPNAARNSTASVVIDDEAQEIQRIQQMIQNSPDLINRASSDEGTPLFSAASKDQMRVAGFLLDHGADVNAPAGTHGKIWDTWTPLMAAADYGHKAMVDLLLSRGADVNWKNKSGETALYRAVLRRFQAVTEVLLASHANVNAPNDKGQTPLILAAQLGQTKIVQMLLTAGADSNVKDVAGDTALSCVSGVSLEIAKALLAAGANPNVEDNDGRTPLSFVAERSSPEMVKMLLAAKADPNGGKLDAPLLCAINNKDAVSAELLLQAGANANAKGAINKDVFLNGSMHWAAGQPSVTPLFLAISTKQFPMVQLLLKFKADPNDSQTDGRPLLFSALSDTNILEVLLDASADPNRPDKITPNSNYQGESPLMSVVGSGFYETQEGNVAAAKLLLARGANPNFKNKTGSTALLYAVEVGNLELVRLLLDNKADPNAKNNNGATPLALAKANQNGIPTGPLGTATGADIAALLRQCGALDVLPDWSRITVSRPSAKYSDVIFRKGTNDWNRFTLFDLLGVQYELLTASPGGKTRSVNSFYGASGYAVGNSLTFPDFTRIVIHRPSDTGTNWNELKINLAGSLDSGDCAADVPLQFGDVVEIPEADHVINEPWPGLSTNALFTLKNCLTRHLQITVNGQTTNIIVAPQVEVIKPGSADYANHVHVFPPSGVLEPIVSLLKFEPFMLWPVLEHSKLLLASSDLSRVKVKRRDAAAGKPHEWTVDCSDSKSPPDFWLRDGDVIEVPVKP